MEDNEVMEIDLRRVFSALRHKAWLIVLVSVLCAGTMLLGSVLFITPLYRSRVLFYAEGEVAQVSLVLLYTGETLDAVAAEANMTVSREELGSMLSAEKGESSGFLEVTAAAPTSGEAKAIADAAARILPQRTGKLVEGAVLKVADAPVQAGKPSSPNYAENALMGAAAGFALMTGRIALKEIFQEENADQYEVTEKKKHIFVR